MVFTVAPFAGARIEIFVGFLPHIRPTVAPFAGARIEIITASGGGGASSSPPSRGRELKYQGQNKQPEG